MGVSLEDDATLAISAGEAYEALGQLVWAERWDEVLSEAADLAARGQACFERAIADVPGPGFDALDQVWRMRAVGAAAVVVTAWRAHQIAAFNRALVADPPPAPMARDEIARLQKLVEVDAVRRRGFLQSIHDGLVDGRAAAVADGCMWLRKAALLALTRTAEHARLQTQFAALPPDPEDRYARSLARTLLDVSHGAREAVLAIAQALAFTIDTAGAERLARERKVARERPFTSNLPDPPDRSIAEVAADPAARVAPAGPFEVAGVISDLTFQRGAPRGVTTFTLRDVADRSRTLAVRMKRYRLKSLGVGNGAFARVVVQCREAGDLDVVRLPLEELASTSWLTYALRKASGLYALYPESIHLRFTATPERKAGGGREAEAHGATELLEQPPVFRRWLAGDHHG